MYRVGYESVDEPLKNLRKLYEIQKLTDLEQRLTEDRKKMVTKYAYLIMHNYGMPMAEKKKLIMALDQTKGRKYYRDNLLIYWKERISRLCKKRCGS